MVLILGHLWGLQSRSPRERSRVRTVLEEGILVVISVKEGDPGEVLPEAAETSATTRAVGTEAGIRAERAAETSATTRAAGTEAGIRAERAAETSATTRAAGTEAGVQETLVGKQVILVVEEIRARAVAATGDVDPTPAFFIRLILRVLWRRVLR